MNDELIYQLRAELQNNILPFWITKSIDEVNGGYYGALSNDLHIHNEVPRSAVLCARILWTFSAAYRHFGDAAYRLMAERAYDYLTAVFWDLEHGGFYWSVDCQGTPIEDRKHHYAQAFGIYGLSEYYRATGSEPSLNFAKKLVQLLETYAFDPANKGYTEGSSREWNPLRDMRLSSKELNTHKSMNTMLHILEAYTNLLRVWNDPQLKAQHRSLIEVFQKHIVDQETGHFRLFFDDEWQSLSEVVSYGHDIEGSWLLCEAAEVQNDPHLLAEVQQTAVNMATAVYQTGLDKDGSIFYEGNAYGITETEKSWWVQAEGMVGFYNAYQLSGQTQFYQAAKDLWTFIQTNLVDQTYGDWYKSLRSDNTPDTSAYKIGPWHCPYHHSRACLEMIHRLQSTP